MAHALLYTTSRSGSGRLMQYMALSEMFKVKIATLLLLLEWSLKPDKLLATGRYSEIIIPFPNTRLFQSKADKRAGSIIINLKNTQTQELEPLFNYDDRVIKRLIVKELTQDEVKIEIFLKDKNLRSSIYALEEPYRLVISIFDHFYELERDPVTGLPLASTNESKQNHKADDLNSTDTSLSKFLLASPTQTTHSQVFAQNDEENQPKGKRKLLQPFPELGEKPAEWEAKLEKVSAGRGGAWVTFPIYVYPIQTAPYEGREKPSGWEKSVYEPNVSVGAQMASYGYKQYALGHENRALLVYQQVLHVEPKIFEKDALHLFVFAESHLGQGNLSLADGYYQTLLDRFKGSIFFSFAKMRRLDIKAIEFLQGARLEKFQEFSSQIESILQDKPTPEILTQLAIRQAFWRNPKAHLSAEIPPPLDSDLAVIIRQNLSQVESQKTSFIAASLLLGSMVNGEELWDKSIGQFAEQYFSRYSSEKLNPYFEYLRKQFDIKLATAIKTFAAKSQYGNAILSFSVLSKNLQAVALQDTSVAWALGESYRELGQVKEAISHYQTVMDREETSQNRLKASFWVAYLATTQSRINTNTKESGDQIRLGQRADDVMLNIWNELPAKEKEIVQTIYKPYLEDAVKDYNKLRSPPQILLSAWSDAFSTKMEAASSGGGGPLLEKYSPTALAVSSLKNLATKFSMLGMPEKRRQSLLLLKKLKAENLAEDKLAKKQWVNELMSFAEELRQQNQLIEAGETFTFAAGNSEDWENRAEALYKGGLLLYKAGKREEAIKAFEQASQDGNNLFYANLAKERLSQLIRP